MAKPILYKIAPFDANAKNYTYNSTNYAVAFLYSWLGRQVKSTKVEVQVSGVSGWENYNLATPIFTNTSEGYADLVSQNRHPIVTGELNNKYNGGGAIYRIRLMITDMGDQDSEWSDYLTFRCFTTPQLSFVKWNDDTSKNQIKASNIGIQLDYSQAEGEILNTWNAYLYDTSNGVPVQQSSTLYASSTIYYEFSGLADNTEYYIRAVGQTVNGMVCDTGYKKFHVDYSLPSTFTNIHLYSNEQEGFIHINSYGVSITGHTSDGQDPEYFGGKGSEYAADFTNKYIVFNNKNISISDDFTLYFKAFDVKCLTPALSGTPVDPSGIRIIDENLEELLRYNSFIVLDVFGNSRRYYLSLWKINGKHQVLFYSGEQSDEISVWSNELTNYHDGDILKIMLQRKRGIFGLKAISETR